MKAALQALVEKWQRDSERHKKHGDCYRVGLSWGLDECITELSALLDALPQETARQVTEQKEDTRVDGEC